MESKLLVPVVCFAELILSAILAEQNVPNIQFLPRSASKELNVTKLKSSYGNKVQMADLTCDVIRNSIRLC